MVEDSSKSGDEKSGSPEKTSKEFELTDSGDVNTEALNGPGSKVAESADIEPKITNVESKETESDNLKAVTADVNAEITDEMSSGPAIQRVKEPGDKTDKEHITSPRNSKEPQECTDKVTPTPESAESIPNGVSTDELELPPPVPDYEMNGVEAAVTVEENGLDTPTTDPAPISTAITTIISHFVISTDGLSTERLAILSSLLVELGKCDEEARTAVEPLKKIISELRNQHHQMYRTVHPPQTHTSSRNGANRKKIQPRLRPCIPDIRSPAVPPKTVMMGDEEIEVSSDEWEPTAQNKTTEVLATLSSAKSLAAIQPATTEPPEPTASPVPTTTTATVTLSSENPDREKPSHCLWCYKSVPWSKMDEHVVSVHRGVAHVDKFTCPVCGAGFLSNGTITSHLMSLPLCGHSAEGTFTCALCLEIFNGAFVLREHLIEFHALTIGCSFLDRRKWWTCLYCGVPEHNFNELAGHIRRYHHTHSPHFCRYCGIKYRSLVNLYRHLVIHHYADLRDALYDYFTLVCDGAFEIETVVRQPGCPFCDEELADAREIERHISQVHVGRTGEYECALCTSLHPEREGLEKHVLNAHLLSGVGLRPIIKIRRAHLHLSENEDLASGKCPICSLQVYTREHLLRHPREELLTKLTKLIQANPVLDWVNVNQSLIKMMISCFFSRVPSSSTICCQLCPVSVDGEDALSLYYNHFVNSHTPRITRAVAGEQPLVSPTSGGTGNQPVPPPNAVATASGAVLPADDPEAADRIAPTRCPICNLTITTRSHFRCHSEEQLVDSLTKLVKEQPGKKEGSSNLISEMLVCFYHRKEGRIHCKLCTRNEPSVSAYYRHFTGNHLRNYDLQCPQCSQFFVSGEDLSVHFQRTHKAALKEITMRGKRKLPTPTVVIQENKRVSSLVPPVPERKRTPVTTPGSAAGEPWQIKSFSDFTFRTPGSSEAAKRQPLAHAAGEPWRIKSFRTYTPKNKSFQMLEVGPGNQLQQQSIVDMSIVNDRAIMKRTLITRDTGPISLQQCLVSAPTVHVPTTDQLSSTAPPKTAPSVGPAVPCSEKTTKKQSDLYRTYQITQDPTDGRYHCTVSGCQYIADRPDHLEEHVTCVHLKEGCSCSICGSKLSRRRDLRRHLMRKHGLSEEDAREKEGVGPGEDVVVVDGEGGEEGGGGGGGGGEEEEGEEGGEEEEEGGGGGGEGGPEKEVIIEKDGERPEIQEEEVMLVDGGGENEEENDPGSLTDVKAITVVAVDSS